MQITVFSSYMQAVQYLLDGDPHYYTASEFTSDGQTAASRGFNADLAEMFVDLLPYTDTPEVADTLVEYAANNGRVAGVEIASGGEAHIGYILLHYTDAGDIVRFVVFQL